MAAKKRIVVFTEGLNYSVRKGIVEIDQAVPGLQWLIISHAPRRTPARLFRSQWRNYRRNGWRWIPYQCVDIWQRFRSGDGTPVTPDSPGNAYTVSAFEARGNFQILQVADLHAENTLETVRTFEPDLGISLAAPILRRQLFSIPRLGSVNLHKGKLPEYRGMPPAFWELWNGERSVGCTVHWVEDKLDTGPIAGETVVEREPYSTLRGLQLCLDEVGVGLMRQVVQRILSGNAHAAPQAHGGKTNRKPTLAQTAALRRRVGQATSSSSRPRRAVKAVVARTTYGAWTVGLRHALAPRITVLLFHRVSDGVRDNLTVGIEQFDRQMALLRKHCQVLSIEEVLTCEVVPKASAPLVCVTFDDGYLDNWLHAAPILLRHQIPAAFFVSTGIVSTGGRFAHDLQRGNAPIPVMQWDQLRQMSNSGFTIGSHSVNHIDCAAEAEETVWSELLQSREDLRRELNLTNIIFAYPYGGRHHMTPQRLELVKRAGYSGCLSAYGGANIGRVERFNVLRQPVHWELSDRMLLFTCLGMK